MNADPAILAILVRIEARMRFVDYRSSLPDEKENREFLNGEWHGLHAVHTALAKAIGIDPNRRIAEHGVTAWQRDAAGKLVAVPYASVLEGPA